MKSSKPISENTGRHLNFRTQRNTIRLSCFLCGKLDCFFKGPKLSGRGGGGREANVGGPGPPLLPPHPFRPTRSPRGGAMVQLCFCTHTYTHPSSSTPGITGLLFPCTSDEIQSPSIADKAPGSEPTSASTHFLMPLPHSLLLAFALDILSSMNSLPLAKDTCILWDSSYIPLPPGRSP